MPKEADKQACQASDGKKDLGGDLSWNKLITSVIIDCLIIILFFRQGVYRVSGNCPEWRWSCRRRCGWERKRLRCSARGLWRRRSRPHPDRGWRWTPRWSYRLTAASWPEWDAGRKCQVLNGGDVLWGKKGVVPLMDSSCTGMWLRTYQHIDKAPQNRLQFTEEEPAWVWSRWGWSQAWRG